MGERFGTKLAKFDRRLETWIENHWGWWIFILFILGIFLAVGQCLLLKSFRNLKILVILYPIVLIIIEISLGRKREN